MFCTSCGLCLPDTARYCTRCGARVLPSPAAPVCPQEIPAVPAVTEPNEELSIPE